MFYSKMREETTKEDIQANARAMQELEHDKFKRYLYSQIFQAMKSENVSSDNPLGKIIEERSKPLPPLEKIITKQEKLPQLQKKQNKYTKRGYYSNELNRIRDIGEIIAKTGKKDYELLTNDYINTRRDDGSSYAGLLAWYKRTYKVSSSEARYLSIRECSGRVAEKKARKYAIIILKRKHLHFRKQ